MKDIENKAEFDQLLSSNFKVVVDFYAKWCAPCKMMMPILEALEKEHTDTLFVKVDVEDNRDIMGEYNVRSVPTLMVFVNGEVEMVKTGSLTKQQLEAML